MMKTLFLLRGVPGAGKSTLAAFLYVKIDDLLIVSSDDFMFADGQVYAKERLLETHSKCKAIVQDWMSTNVPMIAVHNTFTQEWEMDPYYSLAMEYGYQVFSIIVENRHGNDSVHGIDDETREKFRDRFQIRL